MNPRSLQCALRNLALGLGLAWLGGCAGLLPKAPPAPAVYGLDLSPVSPASPDAAGALAGKHPLIGQGPTLTVNPPRAAAGYDSARMLYLRQPQLLEAFLHSEWVEPPARLLGPLIVAELQRGGRFGAVLSAPSPAAGDWRLDVELLRLQQDFTVTPSQLRLSLRATLVDSSTRRVIAWQTFDDSVPAASEDAYGGVLAAQAALRNVLGPLRRFCEEAANRWQPAAVRP
jgi:cholesterol transport system auxiliary component